MLLISIYNVALVNDVNITLLFFLIKFHPFNTLTNLFINSLFDSEILGEKITIIERGIKKIKNITRTIELNIPVSWNNKIKLINPKKLATKKSIT